MQFQQQHLDLAAENVTLSASYVPGEGWHLRVAIRRQGAPWGDQPWTHYGHLSTAELIQAIEGHLSSHL